MRASGSQFTSRTTRTCQIARANHRRPDSLAGLQADFGQYWLGTYYRERLGKVFSKVAPNPRMLLNSRNTPLFQLHFAAANPGRGGEIALKIAEHILNEAPPP